MKRRFRPGLAAWPSRDAAEGEGIAAGHASAAGVHSFRLGAHEWFDMADSGTAEDVRPLMGLRQVEVLIVHPSLAISRPRARLGRAGPQQWISVKSADV